MGLLLIGMLLTAYSAPAQTLFGGVMEDADIVREYVAPTRIMWLTEQSVSGADNLLQPFNGQVSVTQKNCCVMSTKKGGSSAILLDFGREMHGALQIVSAIRDVQLPARFRIRMGESVTEAMSDVNTSNATNDHAMRDFELMVPWLGSVTTGNSGFRFVRIDLLSDSIEVPLATVRAVAQYRNLPYKGSFRCSDDRLNRIWQTGAYTVHQCMQEYVWDGIKRDRLVWIGDMHPEVMTINTVFGWHPVVAKSLDFARDDTPLGGGKTNNVNVAAYDDTFMDALKAEPKWMNNMCSYSLWWILIQRDLYLYQGKLDYLRQQHTYLSQLLRQVMNNTDGKKEKLDGGIRFLDWPTSEQTEVIHAGLQALTIMALEAGAELLRALDDTGMANEVEQKAKLMRKYVPAHQDNKQATALLSLAGMMKAAKSEAILTRNGAEGFSTFFGYYMLEALARIGAYEEAMKLISDYWGGMIDLGATTFWEDFTYSDLARAGRIDQTVPEGKYDIHRDGGAYCYVGMRLSLCHGWASGPTAWLSRHVLGIEPLEAGCRKVRIVPHLGQLQWAEGTFPTPQGIISVKHVRNADGTVDSEIKAPEGIEVVRE